MRPHKYGAKATTVDGIRFASKAEAKRFAELKMLEKAGEIFDLELQPKYRLTTANPAIGEVYTIGCYIADFRYRLRSGDVVVEDVKGVRTELYRWKKKHAEAEWGIRIVEIAAGIASVSGTRVSRSWR